MCGVYVCVCGCMRVGGVWVYVCVWCVGVCVWCVCVCECVCVHRVEERGENRRKVESCSTFFCCYCCSTSHLGNVPQTTSKGLCHLITAV